MKNEDMIPMFVYGTLRNGGGLDRMVGDAQIGTRLAAWAHGFQLHANKHYSYPYMIPGGPDDTVVGDFFFMHRGDELNQIVEMEVGAGYGVEVIEVMLSNGVTVKALTFVLEPEYKWLLGLKVANGDWSEAVNNFTRSLK